MNVISVFSGDMELDDILLIVLIKIKSKNDNFERIVNVAQDANPLQCKCLMRVSIHTMTNYFGVT